MKRSEPLDPALLRREYGMATLDEADAAPDPIEQFARWFADAVASDMGEPNAMVLATTGPDGAPSARTVLLKAFDRRGFTFFTNRGSRKAAELACNGRAALLFPWIDIQRQVEVGGTVQKVDEAEAAAYFASRPRPSQLGAWASRQSSVVADRSALEAAFREVESRFGDGEIPPPPFWGGQRVVPVRIEFWQGRSGRLHDRLRYTLEPGGRGWVLERLAP